MYPSYPHFSSKSQCDAITITIPCQNQERQPAIDPTPPQPKLDFPVRRETAKLEGKVALITGVDSEYGRAVAIAFAREGVDLALVYLYERALVMEVKKNIEQLGRSCLLLEGDIRYEEFCRRAISQTITAFKRLDILVNNTGVIYPKPGVINLTDELLENTLRISLCSFFDLTRTALAFMGPGGVIINTSITGQQSDLAFMNHTTKEAITAFAKALASSQGF